MWFQVKLGTFTSLVEAVEAYDLEALRHDCGDRVRLNRPHMRAHYLDSLKEEKWRNKSILPQKSATKSPIIGQKLESSSSRQFHCSAKRRPFDTATKAASKVQDSRSSDRNTPKMMTYIGNASTAGMRQDAPTCGAGRLGRSAKRKNSKVDGSCLLEPRPKFRNVDPPARKVNSVKSNISLDTVHRMNCGDSKSERRKDDTPETGTSETIKGCHPPSDLDDGIEHRNRDEPEKQNLLGFMSAVDLSAAVTSRGESPDYPTSAIHESEYPLDIFNGKQTFAPNFHNESITRIQQFDCVSEKAFGENKPEDVQHAIDCSRQHSGNPCVPNCVVLQFPERPKLCGIAACTEGDRNIQTHTQFIDSSPLESDLHFASVLWQEHQNTQRSKAESTPSG